MEETHSSRDPASGRRRALITVGLLAGIAALPILSVLAAPDAFLAAPFTEFPIRLWAFETFHGTALLGGRVPGIGFPHSGSLNNVDPIGTLSMMALKPLLGRVWAYNVYVFGVLFANAASALLLARRMLDSERAAWIAAISFTLSPIALLYGVASGLGDILHLWPWALGAWALLRAWDRPGWRTGGLAGALLGIGALACPYHVVVFAGAALGGLPFLGVRLWSARSRIRSGWLAYLRALVAMAGVGGLLLGFQLFSLGQVLADPDSQVSEKYVESTRHHPPYPMLMPMGRDQVMAYLVDYVSLGKTAYIERHMASRYLRASTPGYLVLGLSVVGILSRRRREGAVLGGVALWGILASTGPYLAVCPKVGLKWPINVAWLVPHTFLPAGDRLLEPFRYGFPVSLALALAAAGGGVWVASQGRWGRRIARFLPLVYLLELCSISPVPVPLPTYRLSIPEAYWRLDEILPPGAILDLPLYWRATRIFDRRHFLFQLVHRRPVADSVTGYIPPYLLENQFTAALLHEEKPFGDLVVQVEHPERLNADALRLARDGFVGIVMDPQGYGAPEHLARTRILLSRFGEPTVMGERLIFRLEGNTP